MSTESTHELLESNDPVTSTTTNGEINPSALSSDRYLHKCIYDACKPRWSAFAGVDDEEADLNARTAHVPIIHHHEFVDHGWKTSAISIQDQAMRQVLTQVLDGYQDLDPGLEDWKFSSPFRPLVHRWDLLKSMELELPDGPLKDAVKLLSSFLTSRLTSSLTSLEQTKTTGKLQFDNVWQIFAPGSVVTTKIFREDVICRVVRYSFDDDSLPPRWNIDVEYVDWNGKSTGYVPKTVSISMFAGFRRVTNLPVFPISFLSNLTKLKERFIERGRKFERLRGYKYMLCNGTKVLLETEMPELRPIAAKVCIDAYAYHRSCNLIKLPLRALVDREEEETPDQANVDDAEDSDTPFGSDISMAPVKISGEDLRRENLEPLSDEQCLMTTPWMKGFDLKSKHWCELRVNDLQEMTWNDEAFEKLVLPNGEKDLAWSFVENKILSQGQFDDFIPDKGRGLIILMFGPPGVGKTFTAEAVAERSRVPLYSVSAGELGTEPSEVETALERALELCRMWNAMLLLDEADIFLGTRTNDSLARNELVSIFLTKLEYYQGILFLTTNRITNIDYAFRSRVDLFLPYHDLSSNARRQVWENFIKRAGPDKFDVNEETLDKLSHLKINGREIKNLIKSVQLLSWKNGGKIPIDSIYMLADKRCQALEMLDGGEMQ